MASLSTPALPTSYKCAGCPDSKSKDAFSKSQYKKGKKKLCKTCQADGKTADKEKVNEYAAASAAEAAVNAADSCHSKLIHDSMEIINHVGAYKGFEANTINYVMTMNSTDVMADTTFSLILPRLHSTHGSSATIEEALAQISNHYSTKPLSTLQPTSNNDTKDDMQFLLIAAGKKLNIPENAGKSMSEFVSDHQNLHAIWVKLCSVEGCDVCTTYGTLCDSARAKFDKDGKPVGNTTGTEGNTA